MPDNGWWDWQVTTEGDSFTLAFHEVRLPYVGTYQLQLLFTCCLARWRVCPLVGLLNLHNFCTCRGHWTPLPSHEIGLMGWVVCTQAIDAIAFVINLQEELLEVAWPEDLLLSSHACPDTSALGGKLFAGLRVTCAIHTGIPDSIKVGTYAAPTMHAQCSCELTPRLAC